MKLISKDEAGYLRKNGMGHYIHITSITHKGRAKKYYVVDCPKVNKKLDEFNAGQSIMTFSR